MTEKEREFVDDIGYRIGLGYRLTTDNVRRILAITNHLDKQLAEIKEAGEPFRRFYNSNMIDLPANCGLVWRQRGTELTVENFIRLVKALKEVKDE